MGPKPEKVAEVLRAVERIQLELSRCLGDETDILHELTTLLQDGNSRGILIADVLRVINTQYLLEQVQYRGRYLTLLLQFHDKPCKDTLRRLIEIHGADRNRVKHEAAILEDQLRLAVARYQQMGQSEVMCLIRDYRQRVLAAHLHLCSGYSGARLGEMFSVPRSTAYGWLDWFERLPDIVKRTALDWIDSQAAALVAAESPGRVMGKSEPPPTEKKPAPKRQSSAPTEGDEIWVQKNPVQQNATPDERVVRGAGKRRKGARRGQADVSGA